tara:strand:- start:100 stop:846 length:747 start_codon:yes stop_codon:yes gene_type:complete
MMAGAGWLRSEGVAVHKQVGADSYAPVSAAELSCLQSRVTVRKTAQMSKRERAAFVELQMSESSDAERSGEFERAAEIYLAALAAVETHERAPILLKLAHNQRAQRREEAAAKLCTEVLAQCQRDGGGDVTTTSAMCGSALLLRAAARIELGRLRGAASDISAAYKRCGASAELDAVRRKLRSAKQSDAAQKVHRRAFARKMFATARPVQEQTPRQGGVVQKVPRTQRAFSSSPPTCARRALRWLCGC